VSFAIITPSHAGDFERCALAVDSVRRFVAPAVDHYLIVDRDDATRFATLRDTHTHLLEAESLLPPWLRRLWLSRRWWISARTPPVRGWILQQVLKLAAAGSVGAEVILLMDSDTAWIQPFDMSALLRGNRVRLFTFSDPAIPPDERRWRHTTADLLGINPKAMGPRRYVGNLISWRRENVLRLQAHIERLSGRPWQESLLRRWHLSEYVLYGAFVNEVLGLDAARHYPDNSPWCHEWWDPRTPSEQELAVFLDELRPHHRAVMISAKARLSPPRHRQTLAIAAQRVRCP
jgi:hypothetical protein